MTECPLAARHTPSPTGYLAWHEWAEEMMKTHRPTQCEGCGTFHVWVPIAGTPEKGEERA